jgi:hypothetical protein
LFLPIFAPHKTIITMYVKLLLLTITILAIAFAAIAIKMFVKKDGEFKKQCSSIDPDTGKKLGCSCEGAPSDGSCRNDEVVDHGESPAITKIKELSIEL